MSKIKTVPLAAAHPAAATVRVTVRASLISRSSLMVRSKFADNSPAGITTDGGKINSEGLSDVRLTTKSVAKTPEIDTVPAFAINQRSDTGDGRVTERVLDSLSCTSIEALPAVQPGTEAVMVTLCMPSINSSSITVRLKCAEF
ncbi:MAG: hypothetical protein WAM61_05110 [Desulfobacterales bacterium]